MRSVTGPLFFLYRFLKGEKMPFNDVTIRHEGDHYAVYIDGEFFCSADSYYEAIKELDYYALSL